MNYIDELEREKSHSDTMKAAAEMWMRRAQEAEQTVAVLVHAAGGSITVHYDHIADAPRLSWSREYHPHNMSWEFRTRLPKSTD